MEDLRNQEAGGLTFSDEAGTSLSGQRSLG